MKLAIAYTVYNGLELLEQSVSELQEHVDHVIICWQDVSNRGNHSPDVRRRVFDLCRSLMKQHVSVSECKYDPDLQVVTKINEVRKHELMLKEARKHGCTHITMAACDHFYDVRQFVRAKLIHQANDWDVSFTAMFTYYKHPEWQLTPIEDYYMPFITALRVETKMATPNNYPLRVDPSVRVNTCRRWHLFTPDEIMLHHYSMIRQDIRDKLENAAASVRWKPAQVQAFIHEYENYDLKSNPGVQYFQGRKIKVVPNYFNL